MSALTRCLLEEGAAIAAAATRLDSDQVEAALTLLQGCAKRRAKLVITGVDKSGIVPRKIAATFSSIGLMAIYLNPLDALHGDLGVVAPDDVTLLLSNSGETQELLEILPHLRRRSTARIPWWDGWTPVWGGMRRGSGWFRGPGGVPSEPGAPRSRPPSACWMGAPRDGPSFPHSPPSG